MSGEAYLRFALQDMVQAVTEDVAEQTDKLREAVAFAKQVLALIEKERSGESAASNGAVRGLGQGRNASDQK